MYFTYVVRPGELPLGRSPQCRPFWDGIMSLNLRFGTFLQFLSFVSIITIGLVSGNGIGYNSIAIAGTFQSSILTLLLIIFAVMGLIGSIFVNGFRNIGDDEGSIKYTRGYRCGVKCLSIASILDIIHLAMVTLYFLSWLVYYDDTWFATHTGSNPILTFCLFTRYIHYASLIMYAGAYFYMEAYHNLGTAEIWGWSIAFMYIISAACELNSILLNSKLLDMVYTLTYALGLFSVFIWAQSFEPIINAHEVSLDQSALRNEWFKSKNAMSYYGPPIGEGTEFIKS